MFKELVPVLRDRAVLLTVTLVDGLVLARSAFHHSMNYRSVIIFGKAVMLALIFGAILGGAATPAVTAITPKAK